MKRSGYILLMLATLALSCTREPLPGHDPSENGVKTIHYKVQVSSIDESKATTADNNTKYVFQASDALYVSSTDPGTGDEQLFGVLTLVNGSGSTLAYFEGDLVGVNEFEPASDTPINVTLVSAGDRIHTTGGGKLTDTSYPANEYAADLAEAVQKFSDFTCSTTFGATSFTLSQQSAFLVFSVSFSNTDVPDGTDITAKVFNNSAAEPIWTAVVTATAFGNFTRASFVLAFPGGTTSLTDAELSVQWGNGQEDQKAFSLTNQSLAVNKYYTVSRTTIDIGNPFHIRAKENGTQITFKYLDGSIEFSEDGVSWTTYDGRNLDMSKDDVIYFRGNRTDCDCNGTTQLFTSSDNKVCYIGGEIASLLANPTSLAENAFRSAFSNGNSNNTNPGAVTWVDIDPDDPLILPSVTANNCYREMFRACTSLKSVPALPATEVAANCYFNMFRKCTGLTTANIELPAMTMTENCYRELFRDCSNLTSVNPDLLPATLLATSCYQQMFQASGITIAPNLPATTLVSFCYSEMFRNCAKLNYIKCLAQTGINSNNSTANWVNGVNASGTFVRYSGISWPQNNVSGIPSGWTVRDAS